MIKKISLLVISASIISCNNGASSESAQQLNKKIAQSGATASPCDGVAEWNATATYATPGNLVVRNDSLYKNAWWTQNNDPLTDSGVAGSGKVWQIVQKCSDTPTPGPTPEPTPAPESANLPTPLAFKPTSNVSGSIAFHLNLPYGSGNVENMQLSNNYTDLLISNYVAGALLGEMMHEKSPKLQFNRDYIYGSIFAQLLQENINTSNYLQSTDWINPVDNERKMLLNAGQGGPYQINDYSKRLENEKGVGLINFVSLQKGLGFTVENQDSGNQTRSIGPNSLDQKHFGPMAAAYFHLNDMNRLEQNNSETWGPQSAYYSKCMANLQDPKTAAYGNDIYDLILNAAYNAGTYSMIIGDYFRVCAGMYDKPNEMKQLASLGDYSLSDIQYQSAIGTKEAVGSTFILYPRQIRVYLDQIYNQANYKSAAITGTNHIEFSVADVKTIFQNSMGTLAYIDANKKYDYIPYTLSQKAFETAMAQNNVSISGTMNISTAAGKNKFFDLLDSAIKNLATDLNIKFINTTQTTIGGDSPSPEPTPTPTNQCPKTPTVYPSERGTYVSGTIVKAADGNFYKCNNGVAAWCNSSAAWAYAPATGSATAQAWTAYACNN